MNFLSVSQVLTDCDREPIHNIAEIQSFGALIAVDNGWRVTHRSTNCEDILGRQERIEIGDSLAAHFSRDAISTLKAALSKIVEDDTVERLFGLQLLDVGGLFDCAIHCAIDAIIIEFEPHDEVRFQDHLAAIAPIMEQLSRVKSVEMLCSKAASIVREMLRYDRVMVYKFHRDGSGEVVAEQKREDLGSYLGLRYPKADIPEQARSLFLRNRFRVIADIDGAPYPIEDSQEAVQGVPLDLSMSVLRAHSRMHVRYMKNMGVKASLAMAIVREGRLWGLISCHHQCPKRVPYSLRSIAEMFSQMFSLSLDRLLIERSQTLRERSQDLHDTLMQRMAQGASFVEDLDLLEEALGELIAHDGTSVFVRDEYRSRGEGPSCEEFLSLLPALNSAPEGPVLATSALADHIPQAAAFAQRAAGALILPISRSPRDYLVLWRKPLTQTVRWAGKPVKDIIAGSDRLEPRSSFAAWAETVEGHSEEWSESELAIAQNLRTTLLEVILRMTDEVAKERKRAREQQDLLIAELNHRVRNILNLIRSLVSQSSKDAADIADFTANIDGRVAALATAHDNITRQNWSPAPLASLFESEMEAYVRGKEDRLRITGDSVLLKPEAYTVLALVVHELVTNSAKYGSLCDSKGTIDVDVGRATSGDLLIAWKERGGPPVQPPQRRGFGSTIISRIIPHDLRGEAELNFKLSGLEAEFRVPARFIASPGEVDIALSNEKARISNAQAPVTASSIPQHVLLVEDNMIIALDTEDGLLDAGVNSVSVASTVSGALAAIEKREPDFAIVDFNLGSESSVPVAEELARRGIRFVLATGYSELGSDIAHLGADGLIRKPYGSGEIEQALLGELVS